MAVLKYKSGGEVKTLGVAKSGISGVYSVNGKTGAVTGLYDAENPPPYPVSSVNGKTGAVTGLYDDNNQPPYPVTSVNGKTGDINTVYKHVIKSGDVITLNVGINSLYFIVPVSGLPYGNTVFREVSGYSGGYPIYGAIAATDGDTDNGQCSVRAVTYSNKIRLRITNKDNGPDFNGNIGVFLICPTLTQITFTVYIGDLK